MAYNFTSFHSFGLLQFFLFNGILVYGNIVIDKWKVSLLLATNDSSNASLYNVKYFADVILLPKCLTLFY